MDADSYCSITYLNNVFLRINEPIETHDWQDKKNFTALEGMFINLNCY